jgi:hypothetical protein
MKEAALVLAALATTALMLLGADISTYPGYGTNPHVPLDYSGSSSVAASSSNAVMVALNAQALLLKEMLKEHQSRAAELTQTNQSEKAKWEAELVNELQQKSDRVQKSIEQRSQPGPAANGLNGIGEMDDQLVFFATVDARLGQIRQELLAVMEDSQVQGLRIATNKGPEDMAAISSALGDNQRIIKELQREQLDLELRKLEFRAIKKALQKP